MEKRKNPLLSNRIFAFVIDIGLTLVLLLGLDLVCSPLANKIFNYGEQTSQYYQYQVDYKLGYFDENNEIVYYEDSDELSAKIVAFSKDEKVIELTNKMENEQLGKYCFELLISELVIFFILPLILKNGQSVGCKVMNKQIVNKEDKMADNKTIFIRFFIGVFIIETLIPVVIMRLLGIGVIISLGIWVASIVFMFANKEHRSILDVVSSSKVIDTK